MNAKLRRVQDHDAGRQGLHRPRRVSDQPVSQRRYLRQPRTVLHVRLSRRIFWRQLPVPAAGTDRPAEYGSPGRHLGLPLDHFE